MGFLKRRFIQFMRGNAATISTSSPQEEMAMSPLASPEAGAQLQATVHPTAQPATSAVTPHDASIGGSSDASSAEEPPAADTLSLPTSQISVVLNETDSHTAAPQDEASSGDYYIAQYKSDGRAVLIMYDDYIRFPIESAYYRQHEFIPRPVIQDVLKSGLRTRDIRLAWGRSRLNFYVPDYGIIHPKGWDIKRLDLFTFRVRGDSYYEEENARTDTRPGAVLSLKREPNNPHDPNAVAICNPATDGVIGYVNKSSAKEVAYYMDRGVSYSCRSVRGGGDVATEVLIATGDLMDKWFSNILPEVPLNPWMDDPKRPREYCPAYLAGPFDDDQVSKLGPGHYILIDPPPPPETYGPFVK